MFLIQYFWDIFIGLYDIFENNQNHSEIDITVKHAYNVHTYNELMLTVKLFSFPVSFKHIVKLTDITNYIYNKAKFPVPGPLSEKIGCWK